MQSTTNIPEPNSDLVDNKSRSGPWMQLRSGRRFYPFEPRVDDIDIADIAHALSMQCRYNGHCERFMSVAEHCVLLSQAVSPANALWALLHDATEAYVGDMVRPLKLHMPAFQVVENRIMGVIAEKFGLTMMMPHEVVEADHRILHDEKQELFPGINTEAWNISGQPLGVKIHGWSPRRAHEQYVRRFAELV